MLLNFIDNIAGFFLLNKYENDSNDMDLAGVIGDNVTRNINKEIVYYDWAFRKEPIKDIELIKEDIIENTNQISGRYTVPELNINDKSFIEVLEAVKKYYKNKKISKQKTA